MAPHSDARSAGNPTALSDIAELVGGTLEGGADVCVEGVGRLGEATGTQLSFCALPEYRRAVADTGAAAVVVSHDFDVPQGSREDLALIRVDNPYVAIAAIVAHLHPEGAAPEGVDSSAVVDEAANLGNGVSVGPRAVIGAGCEVGDNARIDAGCVLAPGTRLGEDCHLYPTSPCTPMCTSVTASSSTRGRCSAPTASAMPTTAPSTSRFRRSAAW